MFSYVRAWEISEDDKVKKYCKKKLVECSQHTEWEHAFLEYEKNQIPKTVIPFLARPWPILLRRELMSAGIIPTLSLAPREHIFLFLPSTPPAFHQLPRFFRWLIPFHFAIMSTPRCEEDIAVLVSMGIKRVLTLTEEGPLPASWFAGKPISNTFIPVPNFRPPSIEQMTLIMRLFEDQSNLPLLVHCGGGKGRAGTVAACYIAAYGFNLPHEQAYPEMPASDAVASLRLIRPGSIETSEQENFVSRWCSTIWKQQCVLPELPSEPQPWPLEIVGNLTKDADLFILVGLPGSGKSWLSQALMKRNRKAWSCISQDEAGSRSVCESAIGRQPTTKHILLDRCNVSATDRMEWLRLAGNWVCSPVCVWFNYERDLCLSRAQQRTSHPTLPAGNRVRQAVSQMHEQFEMPSLDEGFKAIITIRSFSACEELVDSLCPPVGILKFPRTPHLINLGGATVDDIILDTSLILGHVVITEKVDGANMGFSLSRDRTKILVQNRSHYVNPTSHAQFKKLGYWLEQHHDDLVKVLNRDEHFAERYVLYGEWMYATHSIAYTHLPGLFMAFDLYDRVTGQFVSRSDLVALLHDTGLAIVPIMHEGDMPSEEVLKDMVQRTSCFWDGRVEGVYVKVEKDGVVFSRMKVVRSDFIPGSDHWSKGALRINGLVESFNSL